MEKVFSQLSNYIFFQENLALIEKLKLQEEALQHLHEQLIQATTNAGDSRENYEK